jgi:hypothetical protein
MKAHTTLLTALLAIAGLVLAPPAEAQLPGPGLTWQGSSGSSAGWFLPGCDAADVLAVPGEDVTLTIWGDAGAPCFLFLAPSATSCAPVAGVTGALALDSPLVLVFAGTLDQLTPCLSCPPGFTTLEAAVPTGLPSGLSVSYQALTLAAGVPALSAPLDARVR